MTFIWSDVFFLFSSLFSLPLFLFLFLKFVRCSRVSSTGGNLSQTDSINVWKREISLPLPSIHWKKVENLFLSVLHIFFLRKKEVSSRSKEEKNGEVAWPFFISHVCLIWRELYSTKMLITIVHGRLLLIYFEEIILYVLYRYIKYQLVISKVF